MQVGRSSTGEALGPFVHYDIYYLDLDQVTW